MNSQEFLDHNIHNSLSELKNELEDNDVKKKENYQEFKYIVEYICNYFALIDDNVLPSYIDYKNTRQYIGDIVSEIDTKIIESRRIIADLPTNIKNLRDQVLGILPYFPIKSPKLTQKSIDIMTREYQESLVTLKGIIKNSNKIQEFIDNDILDKSQEIEKIYKEITKEEDGIYESIKESYKNINSDLEEIEKEKREFLECYDKVFDSENDDGQIVIGLKTSLEDLKEKTENLISLATTVGLAKSFKEQKEEMEKKSNFWNWIFVASIVAISVIVFVLDIFFTNSIMNSDSIYRYSGALLQKIPFTAPLVWLAFYAAKRRGEYEKIAQEYTHKYTNAAAYEGYKEQIENLNSDNSDLLEKLLTNSIEINAQNPSSIISTSTGHPAEILTNKDK